ncbi:MAG: hypothetical protein K1X44_02220 [Alphaproteobacteria bacterium]|nr:hypothetical protein [Alphaproteobacteria bacterium]
MLRIIYAEGFFASLKKLKNPKLVKKIEEKIAYIIDNPKAPGSQFKKVRGIKPKNMYECRLNQGDRLYLYEEYDDKGVYYIAFDVGHHDSLKKIK